ncbi:pulmonary surfactant-associated protein A-like [Hyperolius riggenbachi]|uniref:pulmonary surfactant-associated protein A-like n=1 Tax=Hyperolius riggenbachi TaxID=752182 RepID=UPI0035A2FC01
MMKFLPGSLLLLAVVCLVNSLSPLPVNCAGVPSVPDLLDVPSLPDDPSRLDAPRPPDVPSLQKPPSLSNDLSHTNLSIQRFPKVPRHLKVPELPEAHSDTFPKDIKGQLQKRGIFERMKKIGVKKSGIGKDVQAPSKTETKAKLLKDVPGKVDVELANIKQRIQIIESILKLLGYLQVVHNKAIASSGKEEAFEKSDATCKAHGGKMVAPMNEAENIATKFFAKEHNRYLYLALKENKGNTGEFNYLNGKSANYTNWRKGEPSGQGKENCVEMYTDGQWNDKSCNQIRLTVCEFSTI